MAYAERRERKKGVRYRGIYKAADGCYRSAGAFNTEERALAVALEAERHAAEVAGGTAGGLDPGTRATRTIKEYAPVFLRHHQVEGNTKDTYADTLRGAIFGMAAPWADTSRRSAGVRGADSGPGIMAGSGCGSGGRPPRARRGAGGRSLVMPTKHIWTS